MPASKQLPCEVWPEGSSFFMYKAQSIREKRPFFCVYSSSVSLAADTFPTSGEGFWFAHISRRGRGTERSLCEEERIDDHSAGADVPGGPHITLQSTLSLAEERQYCAAAAQTKREPISRLPALCADRTFAKKHPFSVPFVSSPRRGTRHRHRCSRCTYR